MLLRGKGPSSVKLENLEISDRGFDLAPARGESNGKGYVGEVDSSLRYSLIAREGV